MNTAKFKVKQSKTLYDGSMDDFDLLYKNRFGTIIKLFLAFSTLGILTNLNYTNVMNLVSFNDIHDLKEAVIYGIGMLGIYSAMQN